MEGWREFLSEQPRIKKINTTAKITNRPTSTSGEFARDRKKTKSQIRYKQRGYEDNVKSAGNGFIEIFNNSTTPLYDISVIKYHNNPDEFSNDDERQTWTENYTNNIGDEITISRFVQGGSRNNTVGPGQRVRLEVKPGIYSLSFRHYPPRFYDENLDIKPEWLGRNGQPPEGLTDYTGEQYDRGFLYAPPMHMIMAARGYVPLQDGATHKLIFRGEEIEGFGYVGGKTLPKLIDIKML